MVTSDQGNRGNVREFYICHGNQGKIRDFNKSLMKIRNFVNYTIPNRKVSFYIELETKVRIPFRNMNECTKIEFLTFES